MSFTKNPVTMVILLRMKKILLIIIKCINVISLGPPHFSLPTPLITTNVQHTERGRIEEGKRQEGNTYHQVLARLPYTFGTGKAKLPVVINKKRINKLYNHQICIQQHIHVAVPDRNRILFRYYHRV